MIFGLNTTCDTSKLSQISLAKRLVKLRITILKYHSWYLCQISLQIMLLPIQIKDEEGEDELRFALAAQLLIPPDLVRIEGRDPLQDHNIYALCIW